MRSSNPLSPQARRHAAAERKKIEPPGLGLGPFQGREGE